MAWTAHKPQDCTLNPKHKDYKKNDNKAKSAVVASSATVPSATTTLNNRYAALLAMLATMNEDELWCAPACVWSILLACAAGPLDTGQQIFTYLFLNFLPIFTFILLHLAYPTKTLATAIIKSAPWRLGGKPRAICRTRIKRYKIPVRDNQAKNKTNGATIRTYLFPAFFTAYKVGCRVEIFLRRFSGPPT